MGFIEEMERKKQYQIQQELARKVELERRQQIVAQLENNRRLAEEKEKERLTELIKASKLRFNESGVPELLRRLKQLGGIRSWGDDNDHKDGKYHCQVTISREETYFPNGPTQEICRKKFINIIVIE